MKPNFAVDTAAPPRLLSSGSASRAHPEAASGRKIEDRLVPALALALAAIAVLANTLIRLISFFSPPSGSWFARAFRWC